MANPTTNYGWPMPLTTDLVTGLPAQFAAFGQPVDTSLKALNPATTLGDLQYRSATANTNTRLGIGSTGQVLTVAAGVPSWATPASGVTFSGARVWASGTQSFSNATAAVLTWNSESYDTNSYHSTVTNTGRLTVPSTGYYLLTGFVIFASNATGSRILEFKKNGTTCGYVENGAATTGATQLQLTVPLLASATDYFEVFGYQNSGSTLATAAGGEGFNFFSIVSLGA